MLASEEVGGVVLVTAAKNERMVAWYAGYGAGPLMGAQLSLIEKYGTPNEVVYDPEVDVVEFGRR